MGFNFERFTETSTSFDAKVTIRTTGQLGFNAGAINKYGIGKYSYAALYFDRQEAVVGIELLDQPSEGTIGLRKSDVNTYVPAKNFCDRYGIAYKKAMRYALERDQSSGLLIFRLDEPLNKREKAAAVAAAKQATEAARSVGAEAAG